MVSILCHSCKRISEIETTQYVYEQSRSLSIRFLIDIVYKRSEFCLAFLQQVVHLKLFNSSAILTSMHGTMQIDIFPGSLIPYVSYIALFIQISHRKYETFDISIKSFDHK